MSNPIPLTTPTPRPQGHHRRIDPAAYPALEELRAFARPGGQALIDRVYEEAIRLHEELALYVTPAKEPDPAEQDWPNARGRVIDQDPEPGEELL